jgi:hypothetical protein
MYATPLLIIYHLDDNTHQCVSDSSTIAGIYLSSRIVLLYIVIPLAMTIVGVLTIRNIQTQTRRIAPVVMHPRPQNHHRRNDGQLARMLIIQVGAYLIFSTPAGVAYTLVTFVPSMNTTFITQLRIIFSLWQQSIYFLSFFLYILSSNTYRQQLKQMLKFNHCRGQLLDRVTLFIRTNVAITNTNNNHA